VPFQLAPLRSRFDAPVLALAIAAPLGAQEVVTTNGPIEALWHSRYDFALPAVVLASDARSVALVP
jgi:hypothetical protein